MRLRVRKRRLVRTVLVTALSTQLGTMLRNSACNVLRAYVGCCEDVSVHTMASPSVRRVNRPATAPSAPANDCKTFGLQTGKAKGQQL